MLLGRLGYRIWPIRLDWHINSPSELNILKLVQYIASNGKNNGSMLTTDSGF